MAVQNLRRVALQSRHPAIQLLCYMQRTLQVCSRTAVNRVQHEQAIAHMVLEDEAHLVRTLLEWHISFWSRSVCLSLYKSVGQLRSLSPNSDDVPECKKQGPVLACPTHQCTVHQVCIDWTTAAHATPASFSPSFHSPDFPTHIHIGCMLPVWNTAGHAH